jgi:hypothetical protein
MAAQDGGSKVRERLAGAGARLGEQDAAAAEHPCDRRGHVARPGTRLELGDGPCQRAVVGEDALDERR